MKLCVLVNVFVKNWGGIWCRNYWFEYIGFGILCYCLWIILLVCIFIKDSNKNIIVLDNEIFYGKLMFDKFYDVKFLYNLVLVIYDVV